MIYWRIGLYTERSFWMFLILSNCHAFWDVKMLRLQKFTKPALQRQMLFPRCQAEWFDVFRCISMYFVSFFFLFCHCSCTVCLETLVLGRFCRQVANHCASVTATRFQGHEWHMQDFSKVRQTLRIKSFQCFFWIQKGSRSYFFHFFLNFLVWKFGQDLREAVRKLEVDTVRAPNAGVTKSQKALSKGRERRFLACLRLFKASKF